MDVASSQALPFHYIVKLMTSRHKGRRKGQEGESLVVNNMITETLVAYKISSIYTKRLSNKIRIQNYYVC